MRSADCFETHPAEMGKGTPAYAFDPMRFARWPFHVADWAIVRRQHRSLCIRWVLMWSKWLRPISECSGINSQPLINR